MKGEWKFDKENRVTVVEVNEPEVKSYFAKSSEEKYLVPKKSTRVFSTKRKVKKK